MQKAKRPEKVVHLPSPPRTQASVKSSGPQYRKRPHPNSLAQQKAVQKKPPEVSDDEESEEETSKKVYSEDEVTYWRHIGKIFALKCRAWLPQSRFKFACLCKPGEEAEAGIESDSTLGLLIELFNEFNIKPDVRATRKFRTEVCFHLSQSQRSSN